MDDVVLRASHPHSAVPKPIIIFCYYLLHHRHRLHTIMADNLANEWGCNLVLPNIERKRQAAEGNCFKRLEETVRATTGGAFHLTKAAACGSDANLFATMDAVNGDTSSLCIAAGSYVAGDLSVLQSWSSSRFEVRSKLAVISLPKEMQTKFARERTVALPYRIPCSSCEAHHAAEDYEDRCLYALHVRFLFARLCAHPFTALLLEIILGGNGGRLSDRVLSKLAQILEHHGMNCVVDECLTGGRCGPKMLLTQDLPLDFQKKVTHVTISKWPGIGLVLESDIYRKSKNIDDDAISKRGQSTEVVCVEATKLWKMVESLLPIIPSRRQDVLDAMKLPEKDSWGQGLLMFGSKHRLDSEKGLKNRYLPLLSRTKVDAIKFAKQQDNKENACDCITTRVIAWLEHYELAALQNGAGATGHIGWLLCKEIAKPDWKEEFFTVHDMWKLIQTKDHEINDLKATLKVAIDTGLLVDAKKGSKRTRGYRIQGICHL